MVNARSPVPLFEQISMDLRRQIETGEVAPNEQLPSETELAAHYRVSRMTSRKGIDTLVNEGLVFRKAGKGTFVAPQKIPHGFSTRISFSAAMEKLGLRHETDVLSAETKVPDAAISHELGLRPDTVAVHIVRVRMIESDPVAIHTAWLPPRWAGVLSDDLTGSLTEIMRNHGAVITRSTDTFEAVAASERVADRLQVEVGAPVVRVVGVGSSVDGEPLRCTDALYRADRFRFSIDSDAPNLVVTLASSYGDL